MGKGPEPAHQLADLEAERQQLELTRGDAS